MNKFLSIDQGTTSSRAVLFDANLVTLSSYQKEYDLSYPHSGWVELDPKDVLSTVKESIENILGEVDVTDIKSCGITNQRETTIVWDKLSGKPIYPGIVWQDRRTADYCEELKHKGFEDAVKDKTGLLLDPYFSATKIKWILDNVPGALSRAENGELLFGTIDSYLIYNLTKEKNHLTDITNASRTLLYNIKEESWDQDLLDLFGIPKEMLPDVYDCDADFGTLICGNHSIKINGVIGDQQSALVGQRCFKSGQMKSTFGTGCFLMVNTAEDVLKIKEGLLTTVGYKIDGKISYAVEGSIYSCGNIVKWLRDGMKFFDKASESEKMILSSDDNDSNILFLPAFNGLGAPYWNSSVRGGFHGITQDTTREEMVTAAFESICFQVLDIIKILEEYKISSDELRVDGGMIANNVFCQLLSDTLNKKIISPENIESTALGACIVAMIGSGTIKDFNDVNIEKSFESSITINTKLFKKYDNWKRYINNSLS